MTQQQARARPKPCTLVIFGAAGDLTKRLLVPALYNLLRAKLLPEHLSLIGVARTDKDTRAFRDDLAAGLKDFATDEIDGADAEWLLSRTHYLRGGFDDLTTYAALKQELETVGTGNGSPPNCLFYLATPPQAFAPVVRRLHDADLLAENGAWRRVIVEKPFGNDLQSAESLNKELLTHLDESQIYRIDHYLGKETVQNIMVFRFGNGIFEPLWSREHIDHVQITVSETVGVETRGKFYDATGALRDMVPNHLCQLFSLTAMECPTRFGADAVRTERSKVLDAVLPFGNVDAHRNVVRAQYSAGRIGTKDVTGYRQSPDVAVDSVTETFVAMKCSIDNWRWAGVPFYLRTGKALAKRRSEIAIRFKQAPFALFRDTPMEQLTSNDLVMHIQPDEGLTLRFGAKVPGPAVHMDGVDMRFNYKDYFSAPRNTGYETLIYDCMMGDATLFQRADNIEAGWKIVQPILDAWQEKKVSRLPIYEAGSNGPREADELLERDGREWRPLDATAVG